MRKKRIWSEGEQEYLRKHYPHQHSAKIAKALGRSIGAVEMRAEMLRLKKKMKFCRDCQSAYPLWVSSTLCEECRKKRAKVRKSHDKWMPDEPFEMTFSVFSGWQIVYGEDPKCRSCGEEIGEGQTARWKGQKIYHDSCLGAQKEGQLAPAVWK